MSNKEAQSVNSFEKQND